MSFTEQDMKKQMEDFAALREEFSRLESQEKAMRKQLGLPEQGKTDPASLTPELRKMVEEAEAEARRAGEARAAQARTAARPAAAGGIPGGRPPEHRPSVSGQAAGLALPVPKGDFLFFQQGIIIKEYI